MSDILARLKAAHDGRRMVKVHVPEYGIDLYFPPLTLSDHEAIRRGISVKDEHALMVAGLIHQARNADGSPAFDDTPAIRAELHRMELHVMQRIITEASGDLGAAAAAELAAVEADALRGGLISALGGEAPELAAAVRGAQDAELIRALHLIAVAHANRAPVKNA